MVCKVHLEGRGNIYKIMLIYIVIDCQLLKFCIKIYTQEMYLETYIFTLFCTIGGSLCLVSRTLPNQKNTTHRTQQLPNKIVGVIKHRTSTR